MHKNNLWLMLMVLQFLWLTAGCGGQETVAPAPGADQERANQRATAAVETVEAALRVSTVADVAVMDVLSPTPTIDPAALATAQAQLLATAAAATLTALPTRTPDLAATATEQSALLATMVASTLTAQPTTPSPTVAVAPVRPTSTEIPTATPTPTPVMTARGVVAADQLRLRSGPDTLFDMVALLDAGAELEILGRSTDSTWLRVRTTAGQEGWVAAEFVGADLPLDRLLVAPAPPTPAACNRTVASQLSGDWRRSELGCPTNNGRVTWSAYQPFERGLMLWRSDTDDAYIFYGYGAWADMPERWNEGMAVPDRGGAPGGLQAPIRGFGYVWGTRDEVFQGLGWATDKEKGFCALVQDFDRGFLLRSVGNGPCENGLYNFAVEPGFGLRFLKALSDGSWER